MWSFWMRWQFLGMVKDLLVAADQVLYNLQVAKVASPDFKQEVSPSERKLS
jgi:hypothetical protein